MSIGENIKRHRERRAMTQADLATALNLSQSSIAEWETGDTMPRTARLEDIAAALGVTTAKLIGG
jgi:transcriptional regulator with XRE-family HTH domain